MVRLNFPVINQRITTLSDGTLDPNADWDCVPESLAGILAFYLGKRFEGGALKELVYGRAYRGGTDARAFVPLMAHYGVKLYPIDGDPNALVILAHGHIKAGHPVMITEPDLYYSVPGYTHVVVLDEEHPGGVFAMDPFIAREVEFTDVSLAQHIVGREIWIAEAISKGEIVSISLTTPGVGDWFKPGSGNAWVCKQNGYVVHDAILNFYRTMGGSLGGLTQAGLPLSNERKPNKPPAMTVNEYDQILKYHPEIVEMDFERLTLRYDPNKIMDNPPGSGAVYVIHKEAPVDASGLQAQLDAALAKLTEMEKKIQSAQDALKA